MAEDAEAETRSRRRSRLLVARTVVRATVIVAILVTVYYLLPMDRRISAGIIVELTLGLLFVIALLVLQTVMIVRSGLPGLRAVEAVSTVFSVFILLFASCYYLMERNTHANFTEALTRTDSLYFTITTFATVGYGDIAPVTQAARIVTVLQMLGDLLLIGVVLKIILGAVRTGLSRGGRTVFPAHGGPPSGPPGLPGRTGEPPEGNPGAAGR